MPHRGFINHVHHRKTAGRPMPTHFRRGNATKSTHRAPVEYVLAVQTHMMGLVVGTTGIARVRTKICMANLAFTIRRLVQMAGAVNT